MPKRNPKEIPVMASEAAPIKAAPVEVAPMFPVILNKHYAPSGKYEIVGYLRPKVEKKDAAGKMITVEPERFVEGEMHPAPYPGTGFPGKIWAGTTIRLSVDEAKSAVAKKIAERADAIAA